MFRVITYTKTRSLSKKVPRQKFEFTLLDLYASMARAAVRRNMNSWEVWAEAVSAFLRYDRHFRRGAGSLLLNPEYYNYYKDTENSYLPGRLGDALGLLLLDREGFSRFAHFEDLDFSPGLGLPPTRPDYFCFDGFSSKAVIVECKGSLVPSPRSLQGQVKKAGENQIKPYLGTTIGVGGRNISVLEGHVVGVQVSDSTSWMCKETITSGASGTYFAQVPVNRLHYARLLRLMGLSSLADKLLWGPRGPSWPIQFQMLGFKQREYLFLRYSLSKPYRFYPRSKYTMLALLNGERKFVVFGLERRIFEALLESSKSSENLDVIDEQINRFLAGKIGDLSMQPFRESGEGISVFGDGFVAATLSFLESNKLEPMIYVV